MKWIGVIILAVIGVLAAIVAFEYLTLPIHSVPHFLGGKHVRGHYNRRGQALAVIALAALGTSAYLAVRIRRADASGTATPVQASSSTQAGSADTLVSDTESAPAAPEDK